MLALEVAPGDGGGRGKQWRQLQLLSGSVVPCACVRSGVSSCGGGSSTANGRVAAVAQHRLRLAAAVAAASERTGGCREAASAAVAVVAVVARQLSSKQVDSCLSGVGGGGDVACWLKLVCFSSRHS